MTHIKNLFLVTAIFTFSCSEVKKIKEEIVFNDGNAKWIQDSRKLPETDSLFYLEDPSPLFRKEFKVDKSIKNVKLYKKIGININNNPLNVSLSGFIFFA